MPLSLSAVFCSTLSVATPVATLSSIGQTNITPSKPLMSMRSLLLSVLAAAATGAPTSRTLTFLKRFMSLCSYC